MKLSGPATITLNMDDGGGSGSSKSPNNFLIEVSLVVFSRDSGTVRCPR